MRRGQELGPQVRCHKAEFLGLCITEVVHHELLQVLADQRHRHSGAAAGIFGDHGIVFDGVQGALDFEQPTDATAVGLPVNRGVAARVAHKAVDGHVAADDLLCGRRDVMLGDNLLEFHFHGIPGETEVADSIVWRADYSEPLYPEIAVTQALPVLVEGRSDVGREFEVRGHGADFIARTRGLPTRVAATRQLRWTV